MKYIFMKINAGKAKKRKLEKTTALRILKQNWKFKRAK